MGRGGCIPYSHALFNIGGGDTLAELNDEFGNLLDVDDIFALVGVFLVLDDLGAAGDLEGVVFLHALSVGCYIPEVRRCETCV